MPQHLPPHRLQSVSETRAGSREGQEAGVRVEGREEAGERQGGPQDKGKTGVKIRERRQGGKRQEALRGRKGKIRSEGNNYRTGCEKDGRTGRGQRGPNVILSPLESELMS